MNAEQQRLFHNIATIGTVTAINADNQTMRLAVGDNETDWLSIPSLSAGQVRVWRCPSVGEQFLLISPSGDLVNAIPVVSLYSDDNPTPSSDPNEIRIRYNEHDYLSVHATDSKLHVKINDITQQAENEILLDTPTTRCTGDLKVDGGIHADKEIKSNVEVTAKSVKLTAHGHLKVKTGKSKSGKPV